MREQRSSLARFLISLALVLALGGGLAAPARANTTATLTLPVVNLNQGEQRVLPVMLDAAGAQVVAIDLRITWNPQVISVSAVQLGSLAAGWAMSSNLTVAGELRVAMAGTASITGSGDLLSLTVDAIGAAGAQTPLTITQCGLNDGAIACTPSHGQVSILGESTLFDVQLPLVLGWNLVSLPITPQSTAVDDVLASIEGKYDLVYTYDALDGTDPWQIYRPGVPAYACDLDVIEAGKGYWIKVTQATTLSVRGTAAPDSMNLEPGWNLVGYAAQTPSTIESALASVAGKVDIVYAFDAADALSPWKVYAVAAPTEENDLDQLAPGQGYWILANQSCVWQAPS